MEKKSVAKKEADAMFDPSKYEGMSGFENTCADTFKTPFLKILQALSDELDKKSGAYIEGAAAGDFCNTATKELYTGLNVIVLKVDHELVVWKPDQGGFVGSFPKSMEREVVARKSGLQKWDKDGNDVIDTLSFYCLDAEDPTDMFVFPLSITSFKYGSAWATKLRMLKHNGKPTGVAWAGVWSISTEEERNDKGRWYSVGNSPKFQRFVTQEEVDDAILPGLEILKDAITDYAVNTETDYAAGDSADDNDKVEF